VRESFFHLTPDRVLSAVERGGFVPSGHCTPLICLENRVYDVRLEDASHLVVKFYRPGRWLAEAILEEHRFLADLAAQEIPVCLPLSFADGETLHETEGIYYALWPRTGGRARDELSDGEIEVLGRLLARIHNVGATADAPHRPRLHVEGRLLEPLDVLERGGFIPQSCSRRYRAACQRIAEMYRTRSRAVPLHRIHGDCHLGNLLHSERGWFFLDFDDFLVGPAVQDVWMLLPGRDREGARQRALLLSTYRQFRDFDDTWLQLVEPLRAMRFVWYAGWIARRVEDPAFLAAFPHFGSDAYWERETLDLEEQLEIIARGEEPGPGAA
jgi:Ser/Thr protein kinase RdoA (MazF antagonist)